MKSILIPFILLSTFVTMSANENEADSIVFKNAQWSITESPSGVTFAEAPMRIFDSNQYVTYVKYPADSFRVILIPHNPLRRVSESADSLGAVAAINAGYWNTSTGIPSTYIRIDGTDISHTEARESSRVNGVVILDEGQFDIAACDTTMYTDFASRHDNILSCGPILIDEGTVFDYTGKGAFFSARHPRSAIGTTPDGQMILLVVDGRAKDEADGVSIGELTTICRWLGMDDALNLDGGGSSTLWFDGYVVNHPSDNRKFDRQGERKVSSALVVLPRQNN